METGGAALTALGWALIHLMWQTAVLVGMLGLLNRTSRVAAPSRRYRHILRALLVVPVLLLLTTVFLRYAAASSAASGSQLAWSASVTPPAAPGAVELLSTVAPWLAAAWACWSAVVLVWWTRGLLVLRRIVCTGVLAHDADYDSLVTSAGRELSLQRPVQLRLSSVVDTPLIIGHRHPAILLPDTMPGLLGMEDLRGIVAHELAHVKRADYLHKSIQTLLGSLLLFHPGVRWMTAQLDVLREQACDDLAATVIADRRRYAACLARLEILRTADHSMALAASGSPLLERIRRLAAPPPATSLSPAAAWRTTVTVSASAFLLLLAAIIALPASARQIRSAAATPIEFTFTATDPAGEFTLSLRAGRAVRATVAGQELSASQLVQRAGEVMLIPQPPLRPFTVHIVPGGIRWDARSPGSS
jgi:D-alanyl-D-alanine endopeptidase (penicillin-binding protein 7)